MKIKIEEFSISAEGFVNEEEINLVGKVKVCNATGELIDNHTLRLFITGRNNREEPVEMVLVEHLYLLPGQSKYVFLEGTLFYPVISGDGNHYFYECFLELLNSAEETELIMKRNMEINVGERNIGNETSIF